MAAVARPPVTTMRTTTLLLALLLPLAITVVINTRDRRSSSGRIATRIVLAVR